MALTRNEKQFSLIMLGTDTYIEGVNADGSVNRMTNYEHGETLNATYRELAGQEFIDKAIVSGVNTQGLELDRQVAEGLMLILKAISEGKTDIKIAAHSRGAIATNVLCHKLKDIINEAKNNADPQQFPIALMQIVNQKITSQNKDVKCIKTLFNNLDFNSYQTKTTQNNDTQVITTTHQLNLTDLFKNLRKQDFKLNLKLIDPVPGQDLTNLFKNGNTSWSHKYFVELADIVTHAEVVYKLHERTQWFQAALIQAAREGQLTISTSYGHHGTASGNLQSQDNQQLIERDDKQLLKTRHAQKLMTAKLVDFFGEKNYKAEISANTAKIHHEGHTAKSIESTINKYINRENNAANPKGKKAYKLKKYKNMKKEEASFKKFLNTTYAGLKPLSAKTRQCIIDEKGNQKELYDIDDFFMPPSQYVNQEHIELALSNGHDFIYSIEMINQYTTAFQKGGAQNQGIIKFFCQNDTAVNNAVKIFNKVMLNAFEEYKKILSSDISDTDKKSISLYAHSQNTAVINLLTAIKSYASNTDNTYKNQAENLHQELSTKLNSAKILFSTFPSSELKKLQTEAAKKPVSSDVAQFNNLLKTKQKISQFVNDLDHLHHAMIISDEERNTYKSGTKASLETNFKHLQAIIENAAKFDINKLESLIKLNEFTQQHRQIMLEIEAKSQEILNSTVDNYNDANEQLDIIKDSIKKLAPLQDLYIDKLTQSTTANHNYFAGLLLYLSNHKRNLATQKDKNLINENEYNQLKSFIETNAIQLKQKQSHKDLEIRTTLSNYLNHIAYHINSLEEKCNELELLKENFYYGLAHQTERLNTLIARSNPLSYEHVLLSTVQMEVTRLLSKNEITDEQATGTILIACNACEHPDKEAIDKLSEVASSYLRQAESGKSNFKKLGIALASVAVLLTLGTIALSVATFGLSAIALSTVVAAAAVATAGTASVATSSVAGYSFFKSQKTPKITNAINQYSESLAKTNAP